MFGFSMESSQPAGMRGIKRMNLRVLGCSGSISDRDRTTALLLDDDILIDAGTGVNALTLDELAAVRHVFLTHAHLDHVACLPLMLDSVFDRLDEPVTLHGHPQTLQAVRDHIFNDAIWPDFSRLPSAERPVLRYAPLAPGETVVLGARELRAIEVSHTVPAVGYRVQGPHGAFAFSGDTCTNDTLWPALDALPPLDLLIVETAFREEERELSLAARHYCPSLLADDLAKLEQDPPIYLSHAKPGEGAVIFAQLQQRLPGRTLHRLCSGDLFTL